MLDFISGESFSFTMSQASALIFPLIIAWRRPFRQGCFVTFCSFMIAVYTIVQ